MEVVADDCFGKLGRFRWNPSGWVIPDDGRNRGRTKGTVSNVGYNPSRVKLDRCGLSGCGEVHWNLPPAELYELALRAGEGTLADNGAIVCTTGDHTGRSPNDKFFVEEPGSRDEIWWGKVNSPISEGQFDLLHRHAGDGR